MQGKNDLARANWIEALHLAEAGFVTGDRDRSLLETRARCLAQLGRGPEAVLAAQDALAEYPDNPATVFTVAQVAAYNGDSSSCIAWARRALEANAPLIWFQQPEFERMWAQPAFKALFPTP
jgi:tetratricopeptide (TPR) repeat protein